MHFNPRSPHGERPGESSISSQLSQFQSTLPARGATAIFSAVAFSSSLFQSTLPARGATDLCAGDGLLLHISIHAPRTGSDLRAGGAGCDGQISIHAPRTGSDPGSPAERRNDYISIHAPRTGSDMKRWDYWERQAEFQSTLPARGATHLTSANTKTDGYFNPRSPHGERPACRCRANCGAYKFQSTLPARGATRTYTISAPFSEHFNPRSPHGERHGGHENRFHLVLISIHAPRTGSDLAVSIKSRTHAGDFNPRSPHGERRLFARSDAGLDLFQSTLPARGATLHITRYC